MKSLAEDKDVIDCWFYNIFLGVDFTHEVTFEDLHEFSYWALRYSYDTPSVDVNVGGFSQATVCAVSRVLIA